MHALAADPSTNDTTQTSEELLAKYAATRCERTFRKLHDRHWEEVCNFVTGLLGNHHDAEDVAQEVFIRVHQRLDTYDPGRPVWPWLIGIANNQAFNFQEKQNAKKRSVENKRTQSLSCSSHDNDFTVDVTDYRETLPEDDAAQREMSSQLRSLVAKLPECDRQVVLALHFEGKTHQEAAEALGIPRGTVKSRNHRALDLLRTGLDNGPAV